ncbi:MAG TPA: T9SS type A sorting domain-containing protein [Flavobacteriales bacterium]|nr:T9SS type A sorting domain-containing protein [Flavobacteriales bacterium]
MIARYALLFSLFRLAIHAAQGQAFSELDIGDVRARFFSNGRVAGGGSAGSTQYEVPIGEPASPLCVGGLWIGGQSTDGGLRVSRTLYDSFGTAHFFPGPLTLNGTTDAGASASYDQVWRVSRAEVDAHHAYFLCLNDPGCDPAIQYPNGYTIPLSFMGWPAMGEVAEGYATYLAPFHDFNQDGNYNPADGDAPCIMGDQALFSIFNDYLGNVNGNTGLGVEVHQMPFAFNSSDPAIGQTVFVSYRLINRSNQTYTNTMLGFFNDFDIGCATDDFIGCDPSRSLAYGYNWDNEDTSCLGQAGYGVQPPAFGMTLIKGPLVDADGADDALGNTLPNWNGRGFGDGIIDNERHGLSHFMYFNSTASPCCNDPAISLHAYNYMRGIWKDGTPMSYGGSGYSTDPSALLCAFMFPGDGDPVGAGTGGQVQNPWSETVQTPATPDRRGLMSMGAFTLEPGENMHLLFAYVYSRAASGGPVASVEALRSRVDSVLAFAQTLPVWNANEALAFGNGCTDYTSVSVTEVPGAQQLTIFPVPVSDALHFHAPTGLAGGSFTLRDATGRTVLQQRIMPDRNTIDVIGLAKGVYLVEAVARTTRLTCRVVKE